MDLFVVTFNIVCICLAHFSCSSLLFTKLCFTYSTLIVTYCSLFANVWPRLDSSLSRRSIRFRFAETEDMGEGKVGAGELMSSTLGFG